MKFRAKILLAGKTATGIRLPAKIVESLGPSKRPPVRVTISSYTYRSSVAFLGGEFPVGILMTERVWDSPIPPGVHLDFWTSAYQAIDD